MKTLFQFLLKNRFSWAIIFITITLNILLSEKSPPLVFVSLFIILTLCFIASSLYLMFVYRAYLINWTTFIVSILLLYINLVGIDFIQYVHGIIARLLIMFFGLIFLGTIFVIGNFLWYRDKSIPLISWSSIIYLWLTCVAWKIDGNLIHHWLTNTGKLWWFSPLTFITLWIFFFGLISFIKHSFHIISNESKMLPNTLFVPPENFPD